jgi:hypothetical protein
MSNKLGNSKEERVDSDSGAEDNSYIPRKDDWYYGKIPKGCNYKQLVDIMAKALLKFQEDQKEWTGKCDDLKKVSEILDLWFEHDSNGDDKFDHLVPEDEDVDTFFMFKEEVILKANPVNLDLCKKCGSEFLECEHVNKHERICGGCPSSITFRSQCIYCMFDGKENNWDDEYGSLDEVLKDISLGAIELGKEAVKSGKELPKLKSTDKDIKLIYKLFETGYQLGCFTKNKHPNKRFVIKGKKIEERL